MEVFFGIRLRIFFFTDEFAVPEVNTCTAAPNKSLFIFDVKPFPLFGACLALPTDESDF